MRKKQFGITHCTSVINNNEQMLNLILEGLDGEKWSGIALASSKLEKGMVLEIPWYDDMGWRFDLAGISNLKCLQKFSVLKRIY